MRNTPQNVKLCQDYLGQRRKLIAAFFIGFASTATLTNFISTWQAITYGVICFIALIIYSVYLGFSSESERNYFGRYRKDGGEDLRYSKHVSYKDLQTFKGHRVEDIKKLLKECK